MSDEINPKELVFKKTPQGDLKFFIFKKESERPLPGIVFFFGGGWMRGTPTQFFEHCKYLANRGMVAISAEYRVKTVHDTPPQDCVRDGKSAVRFIRSNAKSLGIDPNQIAAGGGSAGGHVAAMTGLSDQFDEANEDTSVSSRPGALVLFNPVMDTSAEGYGHDRLGEDFLSMSPLHLITEHAPPTLVMLGTQDKLIPVSTAEQYLKKMKKCESDCQLELYEGQGHGFFNYREGDNPYYGKTVQAMDGFLTKHGFLQTK